MRWSTRSFIFVDSTSAFETSCSIAASEMGFELT